MAINQYVSDNDSFSSSFLSDFNTLFWAASLQKWFYWVSFFGFISFTIFEFQILWKSMDNEWTHEKTDSRYFYNVLSHKFYLISRRRKLKDMVKRCNTGR